MNQKLQENRKSHYFVVVTRGTIEKVQFDDILYFESEGRKIHIHTRKGTISFNGSIEKIRDKLDGRFLSCHGSYEVNISKVKKFDGTSIEIEGGHVLPVSKRKISKTRRGILEHLKKHFPCNLEDDIV